MSIAAVLLRLKKHFFITFALLLATLCVFSLIYLALTWAADKSVDELRQKWAPPPSQFIDVSGLMVHVRDEGWHEDPEPVILIHGASSSLHTWEVWAKELKKQHRVITMDLPGFGLTGPHQTNDYSMTSYIQFMIDLMDTLHITRAALGGNALGGEIAWETAIAAPNRVTRLILVNPTGYATPPHAVAFDSSLARVPGLSWLRTCCLPHSTVEQGVKDLYGNPEKVTASLVERYEAMMLRTGNRKAFGMYLKQRDHDSDIELMKQIAVPTLILWGSKDPFIPMENAERFHQDMAGSKLIMFDELGHVPQEENPIVTLAAVNIFLQ